MNINEGITELGIFYKVISEDQTKTPLVLVMGYAGSHKAWPLEFLELLAKDRPVIVFDNRGTGRSPKPRELSEFSVPIMSNDLVSVLKATAFKKFHLLGYSLGGCIALDFALRHPEYLKTLHIVASTAGGKSYRPPEGDVLKRLENPQGQTIEELNRSTWELCMSQKKVDEFFPVLKETMVLEKEWMTPRSSLRGQLHAYLHFDRASSMSFSFPVLISTGSKDPLTPPENSELLHQHIQGSNLRMLEECEHMPFIEKRDFFVELIESFMKD